MTDNEAICTAIVGGFTVLGAAVRWSAHVLKVVAAQVVASINASTKAWQEVGEDVRSLVSEVGELKKHVNLEKKIEEAVEAVVEEVSGVHDGPPKRTGPFRRNTPESIPTTTGYYQQTGRPKTQGR